VPEPKATSVAITRDAARAAPLATRLAAHGIDVVAVPCTRIEPEPGFAVPAGADYDGVAVASVNAADAVAGYAGPVFAVGAATARAFPGAVIAGPDALGLADAILARRLGKILWPRAADGRTDGIEKLRAAGVHVDDPIAYRTVAIPFDTAAVVNAAVICVYAPSQVAALGAALHEPVIAIGETTAAALRARGLAPTVADSPDDDAMARAVLAVLRKDPA
jgi:uroporphyrinogen-III synthase